ncbi:MAG TPA: plastocyanin/azurin family copper-binding protein [Candidatus Limnocylindria bacterium]|nr:plastocyanin/azurin family copper-binding protein [Candidatus Limnocylindria bacterium]
MTDTAPTRRLPAFAAGLGTLVILLAACSNATSSSAAASESEAASTAASESAAASAEASAGTGAGATITITSSSSFGTDEITLPAGQELTVINESAAPHTFTEGENGGAAADARVDENIAAGETVSVSFPEPGDYNVTCLFHSSMNMVVHVE